MSIIAISPTFGSEGRAIGQAVAQALEYRFIDREIILKAAEEHHIQAEKLEQVDERGLSFWERLYEEKRKYLIFIESAVFELAEPGDVVIVGRGGPILLADIEHALRVRTIAPSEVRVRRIMAREQLDHKAAAARVKTVDREYASRIEYLYGVDWGQPELYDLVLNTAREPFAWMVDALAHLVRNERFRPTESSVQKMRDLTLASRVRAALAADPTTGNANIEVVAKDGAVQLKGVVFSSSMLEAAAKVAERAPGVKAVSWEAVEIPQIYPGPMM
jgi:cytidylate kinase